MVKSEYNTIGENSNWGHFKNQNLGGLIFITSSQKLSYSNTYTTNTPIAKSSHNLQEQGIISQAFDQHTCGTGARERRTY